MSDLERLKQIDLAGFIGRHYGIEVKKKMALCPFHADKKPSLSITQEGGVGLFKCHGCPAQGSILDFVMLKEGLEFAEAVRHIRDLEGIREPNGRALREHIYRDEKGAVVYKKVKYDKANFPFFHLAGTEWVKGKGDHPHVPYRLDKIKDAADVIITEGERDAETLVALGYSATSGPVGKGHWPDEITHYFAGKGIRIIYDVGNDQDAVKVARKLSAVCDNIFILKVPLEKTEADITDYLNQFKTFGEQKTAFQKIWESGERVVPEVIIPEIKEDKKDSILPFTIPTLLTGVIEVIENSRRNKYLGFDLRQFPRLTRALLGLRGITVISAEPKEGKTTLTLQIASNVAETGAAVLYYDFENGPYSLLMREFCRTSHTKFREELLNKDHPWEPVLEKMNGLYTKRKNMAIINDRKITSSKIHAQLDELRAVTGQEKALLIIDSLQKLPIKLEERRAGIDFWLREFEEFKFRDPNVAIILISELSREGGKPKESGDIEYTGDFLLRLRTDVTTRQIFLEYARDVEAGGCLVGKYKFDFEYWEFCEI